MARNNVFNCIETWVKNNPAQKFFEKDDSVVVWNTSVKNYWQFWKDGWWAKYVNNTRTEVGGWRCAAEDEFYIYSRTTAKTWVVDKWVQNAIDPKIICVINYMTKLGIPIGYLETDGSVEFQMEKNPDNSTVDSWGFHTDEGKYTFVGSNSEIWGNFECTGENSFKITNITDSNDPARVTKRYKDWESGNGVTPFELVTTDSSTTTEPVADDSFPLKVGKEGPNVVKLQKFLNDKIPSNPLTVNGIFDQKTKDKLIEYQKREGIIK